MSILSNTTTGTEPMHGAAMAKRSKDKVYPAGPLRRPPTHPGQVIGGILKDQHVSLRTAAAAIGVTPMALGNVINGKSAVSAEMALRIAAYFQRPEGASLIEGAEFWLRMQAGRDVWLAHRDIKAELAKIEPLEEQADVA